MNFLTSLKQVIRVDDEEQLRYQLVAQANKFQSICDLTKLAERELTDLYIHSNYQVSQALMTQSALLADLQAAGVPVEEYKLYFGMETQAYLSMIAQIKRNAAEALCAVQAASF